MAKRRSKPFIDDAPDPFFDDPPKEPEAPACPGCECRHSEIVSEKAVTIAGVTKTRRRHECRHCGRRYVSTVDAPDPA